MAHSAPKVATIDGIADEIASLLGAALIHTVYAVDELTLTVERGQLVDVMIALRDHAHYQQLMEMAGVDYPERPERFEVVYHLLSLTRNHRVRVKVSTDEDTAVPSVTALWPVAGWLEREIFDLYGVIFAGNNDLRRILTDYGFRGHPFRKDFPMTGFVEMRYSEEEKRVLYEPVKLAQDFRTFDFMSPWEGAEYVLPGDEKVGEAAGAPTPAKAQAAAPPAAAPQGAPAAGDKTTTDKPSDTGAGAPADKVGHEPSPPQSDMPAGVEKSVAAEGDSANVAESASGAGVAKPKRTRKPKTPEGEA